MMQSLASERGATFIEVISAVSVFALTAVGLSPALLSSRKMAATSSNRSVATTLAIDKIEWLRASSALPAAGSESVNSDGTTGSGIFTRSWSYSTNGYDNSVTGISRMSVTVTWPDRPSPQSVTLVTLVPQ